MIEIKGLNRSFNERKVLDNLNLNIDKGTTCVIIGRSGCGKSVMLKHIVGLLRPEKDTVFVDGQDVSQLPEKELDKLRLRIGMVFQGGALFDSMTVGENVGFGLIEHGAKISQKELLEKIGRAHV